MSTPKRDRKPAATGLPPWDSAPTPPLVVFRTALIREPDLLERMKPGHIANLLPMALDRITELEGELDSAATLLEEAGAEVARLQSVADAAEHRRAVKREYQRDYREGLRGNSAARAALRAQVRS